MKPLNKLSIAVFAGLLGLAGQAFAASYYVVVPMKGKTSNTPPAPPVVALSSVSLPVGLVGSSYSYDLSQALQVTGDAAFNGSGVTWSVAAGALPPGITLSAATGQLTGTPSAGGDSTFTVKATYKTQDGQAAYTLTVANLTVALNSATLPGASVGVSYNYDLSTALQVTGDPAFNGTGVTWSIASGTLPAGLTLSAAGRLTGTPSAGGDSTFTVKASYKNKDGQASYTVSVFNLTVTLAAVTPASVLVNKAYQYDLSTALSSNDPSFNKSLATWELIGGALPTGLTFNPSTGLVAGTVTAPVTSTVTAKVTYKSKVAQQDYTFTAANPAVLMDFEGANGATTFVDKGPFNLQFTSQGGAALSNVTAKAGSTSVYFPGSSRIVASTVTETNLPGDFTIELWANFKAMPVFSQIVGKGEGLNANTYAISLWNQRLTWSDGSNRQGVTVMAANTWYHLAVTRQSGVIRMFVNGNLEATFTNAANFTSVAPFAVGDRTAYNSFGQYPMTGYVDNLRVIPGQALYTASFTPPTTLP